MNQPNAPRDVYLDAALAKLGSAINDYKRAKDALDYIARLSRQLAKTESQHRYIDLQLEPLNLPLPPPMPKKSTATNRRD